VESPDKEPLFPDFGNRSSYKTLKVSSQRIEIWGAKKSYFTAGFILIAVLTTSWFLQVAIKNSDSLLRFWQVGFVGLSLVYLFLFLKDAMTPMVFDKSKGRYWHGDIKKPKKSCRLSDIVGIQIIKKIISSYDSSSKTRSDYPCYELNLVLQTRKRINIFNHGDYADIKSSALTIFEFLGSGVSFFDSSNEENIEFREISPTRARLLK
jgi:hypothetical protein